jgi:hypothetical protein
MACWITFFADGARRNSSRWVLYSRLADAGFLRAEGMISLLKALYGNSPCMTIAVAYDHCIQAHFLDGATFADQ